MFDLAIYHFLGHNPMIDRRWKWEDRRATLDRIFFPLFSSPFWFSMTKEISFLTRERIDDLTKVLKIFLDGFDEIFPPSSAHALPWKDASRAQKNSIFPLTKKRENLHREREEKKKKTGCRLRVLLFGHWRGLQGRRGRKKNVNTL